MHFGGLYALQAPEQSFAEHISLTTEFKWKSHLGKAMFSMMTSFKGARKLHVTKYMNPI